MYNDRFPNINITIIIIFFLNILLWSDDNRDCDVLVELTTSSCCCDLNEYLKKKRFDIFFIWDRINIKKNNNKKKDNNVIYKLRGRDIKNTFVIIDKNGVG